VGLIVKGQPLVDTAWPRRDDGTVPFAQHAHESIGERLKRLRIERGLSQRALSEPGVSYAYISRIEQGARTPSVKALRKLAQRLDVTPEYLETGQQLLPLQLLELRLRDTEIALRLSEDTVTIEDDLRELIEDARGVGAANLATRAEGMLGLAALRHGDHAAAVACLERSTAHLSAVDHVDLYGSLARAYVGLGRSDDAVALLENALTQVERKAPTNAVLSVRYATLLSYALSEIGDLQGARDVVAYALQRAQETEDPYTRVRIYWSDARLAAVAGDPQSALASLDRAVALLEASEDTRQLGRAHLLWAEIMTFDDQAEEAVPHLEKAASLLGSSPDNEDLYWLRTEQARAAAQLGWAEKAIGHAEEALRLIGDTDPAEQGAASFALGEAQAKQGDVDRGAATLRRAIDLLAGQRLWREAAAAARVLIAALVEANRGSEAADVRIRLETEFEPHLQHAPRTTSFRLRT
jgi:transcriptional regulator with XRE-family HTH domain